MGQYVRLGVFAVFLLLGAVIRFGPPRFRRGAVTLLVLYVGLIHLGVVLTEREAWPFVNYQVLHGRADMDTRLWRLDFFAIDAHGHSWRVDPYAFEPLHQMPLQSWVRFNMPATQRETRREATAFLLQKVESARQRLAAGKPIGFDRYLGPFAAPYWFLMPRHLEASSEPYRELRIDLVEWSGHEAESIPPREHRYVLADYRQ